jgi:hypothetical protein
MPLPDDVSAHEVRRPKPETSRKDMSNLENSRAETPLSCVLALIFAASRRSTNMLINLPSWSDLPLFSQVCFVGAGFGLVLYFGLVIRAAINRHEREHPD